MARFSASYSQVGVRCISRVPGAGCRRPGVRGPARLPHHWSTHRVTRNSAKWNNRQGDMAAHPDAGTSARSRAPHPSPRRGWATLDGPRTIVLALVLFALVCWLQASDTNPADALEVLYVVPIALLALRFGLRGGLAGALVGL